MKFSRIALALALSPAVLAAVGDVVSGINTQYVVDGVVYNSITNVNFVQSTRFYDSNKGAPWAGYYPSPNDNIERDSNMCWSHVASNSIQYWQDVYGVFYTDKDYVTTNNLRETRELYNGYYSTESRSGLNADGVLVDKEVGNAKQINVARAFFANWDNEGGLFTEGVDWYFRGGKTNNGASYTSGGYYSNYFGSSKSDTPAYVAKTIGSDMNGLKLALAESLGLEEQADGSFVQVREGSVAALSIMSTTGHAINCVGFNTNDKGELVSIIVTDGDDNSPRLETVYLASKNDEIRLYRDANCTRAWKLLSTTSFYHIREVAYINTPEVLQNMLDEYRDTSEAAVWNGGAGTWSTQIDVVDSEIADESTGWDIYVDGSTGRNITEEHHGYYHGYALEGRDVLFSDHAAANKRRVAVTGAVKAQNIEVTAEGYSFTKGTNGSISSVSGGGSLNIRSGGSLSSEVSLDGRNVQLEDNALLELTYATSIELGDLTMQGSARLTTVENATVKVTGNFTAAPQAATFTMRSSPQALAPSIQANLDLTEADSITLATSVNMNGYNLILSKETPITLELAANSNTIPFFTNIGTLTIGDTVIAAGTNLTTVLNIQSTQDIAGYSIIYAGGNISLTIPEPATATLSILALAALATRRRRK